MTATALQHASILQSMTQPCSLLVRQNDIVTSLYNRDPFISMLFVVGWLKDNKFSLTCCSVLVMCVYTTEFDIQLSSL